MKRFGFLAALSLAVFAVAAQGRQWGQPSSLCKISDSKINESSGIAPSREYPGEYFTHNDSGDSARFFRFNSSGNITAEYSLPGVTARDIEDMASSRYGGKNYVYLGDIGDNNSAYKSVSIYRFEEPRGFGGSISKFDTFRVTYPNGGRNAEAMMVDPKTGDIWIVQKVNGKGGIYMLKRPSKSGNYKFQYKGSIDFPDGLAPMRVITGGAIAPDGQHLVLRTYAMAYEFPIPGKSLDSWLKTTCSKVRTPAEVQGEAICYSLDGNSILTTTEGTPCAVSRIPLN